MRMQIVLILAAAACTGCNSPSSRATLNSVPDPSANSASGYYAVIISPGPAWDYSKKRDDQIGIMEHRKYMASLLGHAMSEGGPFDDALGGLAVLNAESIAEARAIAERDPAVQRGLLKVEVHKWRLHRAEPATQPVSRS